MFFYLSKILSFLTHPINLLIIGYWVAWFFYKKKWSRKLLLYLTITFFVLGNRGLTATIGGLIELPPTTIDTLQANKPFAAAVVLGGIVNTQKKPQDRIYVHGGPDRLFHTVQLYKKGIVKKLIISGGKWQIGQQEPAEATQLKALFKLMGVPEEDLIIDNLARNTRENALGVKKIIDQHPALNGPLVLVTGALHMRRSVGCFTKAGLEVTPFVTDFGIGHQATGIKTWLVPNEWAFALWGNLAHETIGLAVYKAKGWI